MKIEEVKTAWIDFSEVEGEVKKRVPGGIPKIFSAEVGLVISQVVKQLHVQLVREHTEPIQIGVRGARPYWTEKFTKEGADAASKEIWGEIMERWSIVE